MRLLAWLRRRLSGAKPLGQRGEDVAAGFLRRQGYRILARGLESRLGELDIVAVDDRTVVFVEVKTRRTCEAGHPSEAVDDRRRQRMTRSALAYLKSHGLLQTPARFDVVAVTWPDPDRPPTIEHFRDAFAPMGRGQFYC